jgi:hypothetical protein
MRLHLCFGLMLGCSGNCIGAVIASPHCPQTDTAFVSYISKMHVPLRSARVFTLCLELQRPMTTM